MENRSCITTFRSLDIDSKQLANGSQSDKKKAKRRTSKTQEGDENTNINIEKENKKSSATKPGNKEKETELCIKKTLSNGLVIEDLKAGKVKVQYVVTLKENGKVIDSNGKSPYKFRLGMRVGDIIKLTIPPSMRYASD
nr:peptidyl-prolyl cis-trans isomerase FKBP43-like isoform X2 [Tanacetum cinerariifolium]